MKKRFFAVFIALCMMAGMMPAAVFAEGAEDTSAVCSCSEPCMEDSVDEDCAVCAEDYRKCVSGMQSGMQKSNTSNIDTLANETVIYVSNSGGGNGNSKDAPMTFPNAINRINTTAASGNEELKFIISLVDDIEYTTDDSSEGFEKHHTTIIGNGHSITTRRIWVSNEGTTLVLGDKQDADNMLIMDATVSLDKKGYLEIYNGVRFENLNSSGDQQQAITVSNGAKGAMYGGVISGLQYVPQGVIQINDGRFTMYDGEISDCSAGSSSQGYGGAIFMQDHYGGHSKLEIYGGTIKNNTSKWGGAIYAGGGTEVYIKDAVFEKNEAVYGGAIMAGDGSKVEIEGASFKDNKAVYGGAILMLGSNGDTSLEISDCGFIDNKAAFDGSDTSKSGGDGGALYIQDAKITVADCNITGNTAENSGGGLYFTGTKPVLMELNIEGATRICDNTAVIANNVYLVNLTPPDTPGAGDLTEEYQTFITVADGLKQGDESAWIGIYMDKPGIFTKDYKTKCGDVDPSTYFFSDHTEYHTAWTEDKTEARLVEGRAKYLIQVEAGSHGAITPEGEVMVEMGEDITFTITPDSGYKISDVIVDGESIGAVGSYTFKNVNKAHTIKAVFEKNSDGGSSSGGSSYSLSSENYYVRYNDGDDLVKDGKYGKGERVTVKDDVFEAPLGKVLAGWSTEEGGEVEYLPGDTFRMPDKSVNLYAVWEDETQIHNAYISGYPDGTIGPDRTITRAEAAVMLYNLLDEKTGYLQTFTDVPPNEWYSEAVITLAGMGVINGYPDKTFRPDSPITRGEFVTMAVNFAGAKAGEKCGFSDVSRDMWHYGSVARATEEGWISGYPDGTFGPDRFITRGEVTSVINRMENRSADMDFIGRGNNGLNTFEDLPEYHWAYADMMEAANGHGYVRGEGYEEIWTDAKR